jgi:UDP-N-acetylglucosamine--N-acetylmuramyl-(pentapeptide) pyrophosphoryl-undecaprenol N-acetylglucosamine transferase
MHFFRLKQMGAYMRVLIMAGGTGGHIFPALAVAKRLLQQGHTVHWLGTRHGMELGITQANNIKLHTISISGLRGKGLLAKLLAPYKLSWALLQALIIIRQFQPDVVLGMGGYVTGPAGLAAWVLRKRLVIHEQNAIAGMTNQILAKFSYKVLEAFPNSFPSKVTTHLTGNPVREEFHQLLPPERRNNRNSNTGLKILILGGSGGAQALNSLMPQILSEWPIGLKPIVWHQAGSKHLHNAKQAYLNAGLDLEANIKLVDFIQDMPNAYAWADLVICRAGALTIAELAAAGVASILIPFPYAVDDHQTKNAQFLVNAGAAILMQERALDVAALRKLLQDFAVDHMKILTMAQAARKVAKPDALEQVVSMLL